MFIKAPISELLILDYVNVMKYCLFVNQNISFLMKKARSLKKDLTLILSSNLSNKYFFEYDYSTTEIKIEGCKGFWMEI